MAEVAESADALRSGRSVRKDVRVQIPPSAPVSFILPDAAMHDVCGPLTRQYGDGGQDGRCGASRRGKSEQHRAGCPAKAGEARRRADSPALWVGVRATAREQQKRAGRFGGSDETGNPPCCNLRSGRTQPIPVADGGSPRPKVESSREGDDAARPGLRGGDRWPSAQRCVNRTRLTRLPPPLHVLWCL